MKHSSLFMIALTACLFAWGGPLWAQAEVKSAPEGITPDFDRYMMLLLNEEYDSKVVPGLAAPPGYSEVEELVDMGRKAVPFLIKALKREESQARARAALTLGRIGDPRALEPLLEMLERAGIEQKKRASMTTVPGTTKLWDEEGYAARALGLLGDRRAVESLIKVMKNGTTWSSHAAAIALGRIGDPRATAPLIEG